MEFDGTNFPEGAVSWMKMALCSVGVVLQWGKNFLTTEFCRGLASLNDHLLLFFASG